jgi:hypothetical protein
MTPQWAEVLSKGDWVRAVGACGKCVPAHTCPLERRENPVRGWLRQSQPLRNTAELMSGAAATTAVDATAARSRFI